MKILIIIVAALILIGLIVMISLYVLNNMKMKKFRKQPRGWIVKYWRNQDSDIGRVKDLKDDVVYLETLSNGDVTRSINDILILHR
jgi:hypothetical protein